MEMIILAAGLIAFGIIMYLGHYFYFKFSDFLLNAWKGRMGFPQLAVMRPSSPVQWQKREEKACQ
jgi:hypothetical protein